MRVAQLPIVRSMAGVYTNRNWLTVREKEKNTNGVFARFFCTVCTANSVIGLVGSVVGVRAQHFKVCVAGKKSLRCFSL